MGCETDDAQTTGKLTVTLSAADATTRVSVNGVQVANQNGELSGLDGYRMCRSFSATVAA